jgi:hypothetical protein
LLVAKLSNQLRAASAELVHLEKQLARLEARTAGKRLEVARLQAAVARESGAAPSATAAGAGRSRGPRDEESSGDLPARRTSAIVAVLRRRSQPMSPSEITDALNELGRNEELRSVTATLAHLQKSQRVARVGRGMYVAL